MIMCKYLNILLQLYTYALIINSHLINQRASYTIPQLYRQLCIYIASTVCQEATLQYLQQLIKIFIHENLYKNCVATYVHLHAYLDQSFSQLSKNLEFYSKIVPCLVLFSSSAISYSQLCSVTIHIVNNTDDQQLDSQVIASQLYGKCTVTYNTFCAYSQLVSSVH